MSSPSESQIPDPKVPAQDEPNHSSPRPQTETLEEESQKQDNPQNQEIAAQEDPKSNEEFSGEALPLLPDIQAAVPPIGGDMLDAPSASPATLTKPASKRKKGKQLKKQQAIDKKLSTLKRSLNPLPFKPSKIFDFDKHEKLMKQLGLWEFVHIEFDQNIRADLIAQLVASYDPKCRYSYVNAVRIQVGRANLARALKLHVKKEKGGATVFEGEDLVGESLSDESVGFIEDFVSNWVLLHEDAWMMPSEVVSWTKLIKDKHPEKVDWAGMFWFMVEKELTRGDQLVDCYYAAHLQCLIKSQREGLFSEEPEEELLNEEPEKAHNEEKALTDEPVKLHNEDNLFTEEPEKAHNEEKALTDEPVKLHNEDNLFTEEPENVEDKEEEGGGGEIDVKEGQEEGTVAKEPNVELTLGHDMVDAEMVECEEPVVEEEEEQEKGEEPVEHEPFLQHCSMKGPSLDDSEQTGEEDVEMEDDYEDQDGDDGFVVFPNVDTIGGLLPSQSSVELLASRADLNSGSPFFNHGCKREIEHDPDMATHSLGANKRLRMEEGPSNEEPSDLVSCIDKIQQLMTRARMMFEATAHNEREFSLNNQYLLDELHKRDNVIQHINKTKYEEVQKRDEQIYRLERELFMMGNILEGYRKALKSTHDAFAEYRSRAQLPEEPIYKDAGPGGLVLSSAEIEQLQLKQEEEFRSNCLFLELKAKDAEECFAPRFEMLMEKVLALDSRLTSVFDHFKELKELHDNRKALETQQPADITEETPKTPPEE